MSVTNLASYGELFDDQFINVGSVVLENIDLCYSYLILIYLYTPLL